MWRSGLGSRGTPRLAIGFTTIGFVVEDALGAVGGALGELSGLGGFGGLVREARNWLHWRTAPGIWSIWAYLNVETQILQSTCIC